MKHLVPEYTFDPETESGMDIEAEAVKAYAEKYRKKIKDYTLGQLFTEISELQIDYDSNAPLGIRILDIIRKGIDNHLYRNR